MAYCIPVSGCYNRSRDFRSKVEKLCTGGIEVRFSKAIDNGFRIGPKDEGYLISFTDEDFKAIISEYLRPKTRKLLFGE